ncbi:hypothetical protein OCS_04340 [Ophiocordyceps sinensis CO18]|uniref:Uncharacterized protein n=1 Tax=Ophiocordyceps sinensis (strain Co18 / CGMCC 3.14243) TaxID=911162 RepID=T5A3B1_OPHSC|nr:hypothetical protein OCS_04340 [Ophiocordyceps sinensis CO18]
MTTTHIVEEPPHDRQAHRRSPFSTWVKKLTTFKSSSDAERPKRNIKMRRGSKLNNPYPQSGHVSAPHHRWRKLRFVRNGADRQHCLGRRCPTVLGRQARAADGRGWEHGRHCVDTERRAAVHDCAQPRGQLSCGDKPYCWGRHGVEERRQQHLFEPGAVGSVADYDLDDDSVDGTARTQRSIHFSQPFPSTSPASAIPAHLAPTGHPTTYTAATANNMLTDNASILTLASSSKRRRRRSMDTDASVRALAPSSLWGGSRESLPLSVLSANIESPGNPATPGMHGAGSRLGAERNSIYSTAGVAPTLASERNSLYAKQGDGASVRSGLLGQGRPDSVSGNNAMVMSPLASPREVRDEKTAAEDKEASRTAAQREY